MLIYFSFLSPENLTLPCPGRNVAENASCGYAEAQWQSRVLEKMSKDIRYTIFRTNWGYFGLMGTSEAIIRTFLPVSSRNKVKQMLLAYRPQARYDSGLFGALQESIRAYFGGERTDFVSVPVDLSDYSAFTGKVLSACGRIGYGQTAPYAQLAQLAHAPKAVRAAGSVMAKNPIPLIIPCHRIIRSDGSIGNFSAHGGRNLKKRLLDLEAKITAGSAEAGK